MVPDERYCNLTLLYVTSRKCTIDDTRNLKFSAFETGLVLNSFCPTAMNYERKMSWALIELYSTGCAKVKDLQHIDQVFFESP